MNRREFTQLKTRLLLATTNFPDRTCVGTFAPTGSSFTLPDNDGPHSDRRFLRAVMGK
jgi:hypothetical protein